MRIRWGWEIEKELLYAKHDVNWTIQRINIGTDKRPTYRYSLQHRGEEVKRYEKLRDAKRLADEFMGVLA